MKKKHENRCIEQKKKYKRNKSNQFSKKHKVNILNKKEIYKNHFISSRKHTTKNFPQISLPSKLLSMLARASMTWNPRSILTLILSVSKSCSFFLWNTSCQMPLRLSFHSLWHYFRTVEYLFTPELFLSSFIPVLIQTLIKHSFRYCASTEYKPPL